MIRVADFAPKPDRPGACRGAAALLSALETIGGAGGDHAMAAIICAEELALRELVRFALLKLASEDQQ